MVRDRREITATSREGLFLASRQLDPPLMDRLFRVIPLYRPLTDELGYDTKIIFNPEEALRCCVTARISCRNEIRDRRKGSKLDLRHDNELDTKTPIQGDA